MRVTFLTNRQKCLALVACFYLLVSLPFHAGDNATTNRVIHASGSWTVNGHTVEVNDSIPEGACLVGKGEIEVVRRGVTSRYSCGRGSESGCATAPAGLCTRRVPPLGIFEGYADRLLSIVEPLLTGDSRRYIVAASRDSGPELKEGVLPANLPAADAGPIFASFHQGKYRVQVARIDAPGIPHELSVTWDNPSGPTIPTTEPGIYSVALVEATGEYTGPDAWVLVVAQDTYASTNQLFARVVEITDKWRPEVTNESIRSVRRAYLEALRRGKITHQE